MKRLFSKILALGLFCSAFAASHANVATAQISIVATVNGKPITNYDVEQRAAFLGYATGIAITDANRNQIESDALELLIDDKIRLIVAKDAIPNIESRALPDVRKLIDQNFGSGDRGGALVLRDAGFDPITVQQKYLSDLAWSNFIRTKYGKKFDNIESQIDDELARLEANVTKPQLRLAEIVLTPGPTRDLARTKSLATEMVAAIRKGASFTEIARQYSVAGSASRGGNVGWAMTEKLPKAFRDALTPIANGEITDPITLDGVVYILRRAGERKEGLVDISEARVWLARAVLPLSATASDAERLEAGAKIARDTENLTTCDQMVALNETYATGSVARLDNMLLADFAPQMQALVKSLKVGKASEPLAFAEGIASMMICELKKPDVILPERSEIRETLIDKLFGSLSERQLLRNRRTAVIERFEG